MMSFHSQANQGLGDLGANTAEHDLRTEQPNRLRCADRSAAVRVPLAVRVGDVCGGAQVRSERLKRA